MSRTTPATLPTDAIRWRDVSTRAAGTRDLGKWAGGRYRRALLNVTLVQMKQTAQKHETTKPAQRNGHVFCASYCALVPDMPPSPRHGNRYQPFPFLWIHTREQMAGGNHNSWTTVRHAKPQRIILQSTQERGRPRRGYTCRSSYSRQPAQFYVEKECASHHGIEKGHK